MRKVWLAVALASLLYVASVIATIYTTFKVNDNADRITKVERKVVKIKQRVKGVMPSNGNSPSSPTSPPSGGRRTPPEKPSPPVSQPSPSPESPDKGVLGKPIETVCGVTSALNLC